MCCSHILLKPRGFYASFQKVYDFQKWLVETFSCFCSSEQNATDHSPNPTEYNGPAWKVCKFLALHVLTFWPLMYLVT
jgi:hypothetical protein